MAVSRSLKRDKIDFERKILTYQHLTFLTFLFVLTSQIEYWNKEETTKANVTHEITKTQIEIFLRSE